MSLEGTPQHLEKPTVLILDPKAAGGYINAVEAIAAHAGWNYESFKCPFTAYEHLSNEGGTQAVIASFEDIGRLNRRDKIAKTVWHLITRADELEISQAIIYKNMPGTLRYGSNGRDVSISMRSRPAFSIALSNWFRGGVETSFPIFPDEPIDLAEYKARKVAGQTQAKEAAAQA